MLKNNLKLVRKFIVLAILLGGLALAGLHENQPVKAWQCCSHCEVISGLCQSHCEADPNSQECHACTITVNYCSNHCSPDC